MANWKDLEKLDHKIINFSGILYTSQESQDFKPYESKATFFCLQPELCILATTHHREDDFESKNWVKRWWHTYNAEGLSLLKYELWIDQEVSGMPEKQLAEMVKRLGCDGWMVAHKKDQNSEIEDITPLINTHHKKKEHTEEIINGEKYIYPTVDHAMYEIAVFPHARHKLTFKNKLLERDFFRPTFKSQLRQGILPLVRKSDDEYDEEITSLKKALNKTINNDIKLLDLPKDLLKDIRDGLATDMDDALEELKELLSDAEEKMKEQKRINSKRFKLRF